MSIIGRLRRDFRNHAQNSLIFITYLDRKGCMRSLSNRGIALQTTRQLCLTDERVPTVLLIERTWKCARLVPRWSEEHVAGSLVRERVEKRIPLPRILLVEFSRGYTPPFVSYLRLENDGELYRHTMNGPRKTLLRP